MGNILAGRMVILVEPRLLLLSVWLERMVWSLPTRLTILLQIILLLMVNLMLAGWLLTLLMLIRPPDIPMEIPWTNRVVDVFLMLVVLIPTSSPLSFPSLNLLIPPL